MEYHSINLKKKGVSISFKDWNGEYPVYDNLIETWVVIEGLPPKWCSWYVMTQVASIHVVLFYVDWHTIFRSFYEKVRIQVAVRDPSKIPKDRVVEINHEQYLLQFMAEKEPPIDPGSDNPSDPGDSNNTSSQKKQDDSSVSDDDLLGEEMDTGNEHTSGKTNNTPRHSATPRGSRTATDCITPAQEQHLEKTVFSKIQGAPITKSYLEIVKKKPTDNIGSHLLQRFDNVAVPCATAHTGFKSAALKPDKWGPTLATRMSSGINRDGKPALQKAQELKQVKDLEIPKPMKVPITLLLVSMMSFCLIMLIALVLT